MPLIIDATVPEFVLDEISKGDVINAQYKCWDESMNILVVDVKERFIQAVYLPKIHATTCYIKIKAVDVAKGDWKLRYSHDLTEVKEVIVGGEENADEGSSD